MCNVGAQYQIIGRITHGTFVSAYVCVDRSTGCKVVVSKQDTEKLALNKQIYNCTAQAYNGIVNLKGIKCKLNQLPRYTEDGKHIIEKEEQKQKVKPDLEITAKVQHGRTVMYYEVTKLGDVSKKARLTKGQVIELARSGRLVNAKCQMNGNEVLLRGTNGCNLTALKTYQI